jgi:flagellar biosynthesis/type III secretory pathway protein FliH
MSDLFEPIIDLESEFIQEGRKEGLADGIQLGILEGYTFGKI